MWFLKSFIILFLVTLSLKFSFGGSNELLIIGPTVQKNTKLEVFVYFVYKGSEKEKKNITDIIGVISENVNLTAIVVKEDNLERLETCTKIFDYLYRCTFNIKEKILSDFKINAEFLNSQNQSVTVTSIKKDFSVFIQTDKAIYKPGDKIRMRIFFLEPTGLPVSTKNLKTFRIEIRNSYNQLIQQHTHTYVKKVYKKSMNLSSNCFIGKYKILIWKNIHYEEDNVDPDDESKEITDDGDEELSNDENTNPYEIENAIKIQEFEVKKLVLPEFEVKIETDRYVRHKENIKLKIYALYKFGKFASGNATVIATIRSSDKILRKVKKEIYIETAENLIISQSKEELDVRNDILQYDVNIVVSFEERLTKQTLTASTTVSIVNSDKFQLVIYPEHENFVPGQNLKVDVYVREIDGKFLETSYKYVEFKTKMNFKTKLCEKIILNAKQYLIKSEPPKRIIDKKATFNIKVPDNTTSIEITATYATFSETFNIFRKNSMTREYLTMKVQKKETSFSLTFYATAMFEDAKFFYILLMGERGEMDIKKFDRKQPKSKSKNKIETFTFKKEKWMEPFVNIIAFYYSQYREVVFDAVKVEVPFTIPNRVNVNYEPNGRNDKPYKPGDDVVMNIRVEDRIIDNYTTFHLIAFDKKVQLLGKTNEITKERYFKEMVEFNTVSNDKKIHGAVDGRYESLSKFNTFFLTDAYVTEDQAKELCNIKDRNADEGKVNTDDSDNSGKSATKRTDLSSNLNDIRKNFDEIWLFDDYRGDEIKDGILTVKKKVPDSISTFMVNAFIYHPVHGIGIADETSLTVMKEFFVETFLPYSIFVGEVLKLKVLVFNYLPGSSIVTAEVNLKILNQVGDAKGEFVRLKQDGNTCKVSPDKDGSKKSNISIPPQKGEIVYFSLRAKTQGKLKIQVSAKTGDNNDIIEKELLVEHSGTREIKNFPKFIYLRNNILGKVYNDHFSHSFPDDTEKNSISVYAKVYGNLLGQVLVDAEKLIKIPSGCTEQTFKSWKPNIVAYDYLRNIGKLTDATKERIKTQISAGYQKILAQIKTDGSISLWNESENDRTWLTAYLVKLLTKAKDLIDSFNSKILYNAINFLLKHQNENGSFQGESVNNYYYMKSESQKAIPLTAFVISALIESDYGSEDDNKKSIEKGVEYLQDNIIDIKDPYTIAITAYALIQWHSSNETILESLLQKLNTESSSPQKGQIFWYKEKIKETIYSYHIETAAYALMTFMKREEKKSETRYLETAIKIMNWMMTNKNPNGGFYSTVDTVVGVDALALIAKKFINEKNNLNLTLTFSGEEINHNLNDENSNNLKEIELSQTTNDVSLNVSGSGLASVSVTYDFVVPNYFNNTDSFDIQVGSKINETSITLNIKVKFIPKESSESKTRGMAIVEINLPTGFEFVDEKKIFTNLNAMKANVKIVEFTRGKSSMNLYFEYLDDTFKKFHVIGYRKSIVSQLKKRLIRAYDYYEKEKIFGNVYYDPNDSSCQ